MRRVACYFDGFNLYHAIDDLRKPHLKWLDISALATSLCRADETLVKTAYFSAYATWMADAYARHRAYVSALQTTAVECHMARFSEKKAHCKKCGAVWKRSVPVRRDVHQGFAQIWIEKFAPKITVAGSFLSFSGDGFQGEG